MIEKFKMATLGRNDRNVKSSVEQIKQQVYVNNIENKTKINELIDELDANNTEIENRLDTAESTISGHTTSIYNNTQDISDLESMMTYSSTENVVGRWIDGKPIYRKVIDFGTLPNTTIKIVSTGLSTSEVNLIKLEGLAIGISNGGTSYLLTLPDVNPAGTDQATRLTGNSEDGIWRVIIQTGVDRTNYTAYISVYYTKN